jgi:hypothetical protein
VSTVADDLPDREEVNDVKVTIRRLEKIETTGLCGACTCTDC